MVADRDVGTGWIGKYERMDVVQGRQEGTVNKPREGRTSGEAMIVDDVAVTNLADGVADVDQF